MESEHDLNFFQNLVSCGHNLYVWCFEKTMELKSTSCPLSEQTNRMLMQKTFPLRQLRGESHRGAPLVIENELGMTWIAAYPPEDAKEAGATYLIGPAFIVDPPSADIDLFLWRSNLSVQDRELLKNAILSFPVISLLHFYDYGLMLQYCVSGEKLSVSDFIYAEDEKPRKRHEPEEGDTDTHGTWAMEQELMRLIEEGNLNFREQISKKLGAGSVGHMGNGDPTRHLKNAIIVSTALVTRAAIRGGLSPEIAYTLSDRYINEIEASHTIAELAEISTTMQDDFVHRVHQIKIGEGCSQKVQYYKNYLQLHINEKLSVKAFAEKMGISITHLARLFREDVGMTVSEYVMSLKVEAAKDLLRAENKTMQEICSELGFCSQSYFGMKFKQHTGLTPTEFRKQYRVGEFLKE